MDLNAILKECNLNSIEDLRNTHFFTQMEGVKPTLFAIMGIAPIGINDGKCTWRECVIDETRYKIEDGYKITLKAIDGSNGKEHFYQSDFLSGIRGGFIKQKQNIDDHIEHVCWREPVGNGLWELLHEADVLICQK